MKISLASKIIAVFLLIGLVSILLTSIISFINAKTIIEERLEAQLTSVTVLKENQIKFLFDRASEDILGASSQQEVMTIANHMVKNEKHDLTEHETLHSTLISLNRIHKDFNGFMMIDIDGRVHSATDEKEEGKIMDENPVFTEGMKGVHITKMAYSVSKQEPIIMLSAPIKSENKTLAVFAGYLNTKVLSDIMAENSGLGTTGETYLVNKHNYAVTELLKIENSALQKLVSTDIVKKCISERNEETKFLTDYEDYFGDPVIGSYKWIPEHELCIISEIDDAEAFAPVNKLRDQAILVALILFIIIVISGYVFSKQITKSLTVLKTSAENIIKGDLDQTILVKSDDEIGDLSKAFNEMQKEVKKSKEGLEEQIKKRTKELQSKVEQLEKFKDLTVDTEIHSENVRKENEELKKRLKEAEKKSKKKKK